MKPITFLHKIDCIIHELLTIQSVTLLDDHPVPDYPDKIPDPLPIKPFFKQWTVDEMKNYKWNTTGTNHFTQVIWGRTSKVP